MEKIKICDRHNYKVPLIYTFAFNGAEYWCPYCGVSEGMLGAGKNIEVIPSEFEKLTGRKQIYIDTSQNYLDANGFLVCSARKFNGIKIERKDFSPNMIDEVRKYIKENKWKYNQRATKLIEYETKELMNFSCLSCALELNGKDSACKEAWKNEECICKKWQLKK